MKRMQHEKTWIKRGNCQLISPPATGFEPNPPILRQLLDDYDSQNHCFLGTCIHALPNFIHNPFNQPHSNISRGRGFGVFSPLFPLPSTNQRKKTLGNEDGSHWDLCSEKIPFAMMVLPWFPLHN